MVLSLQKNTESITTDLTNDYGIIWLNSLEGKANINCDYGVLIIGELFADNNILAFHKTFGIN